MYLGSDQVAFSTVRRAAVSAFFSILNRSVESQYLGPFSCNRLVDKYQFKHGRERPTRSVTRNFCWGFGHLIFGLGGYMPLRVIQCVPKTPEKATACSFHFKTIIMLTSD